MQVQTPEVGAEKASTPRYDTIVIRGATGKDVPREVDGRERIGNAVPPAAAEAIAGVMGTTLLLAEQGETFMLSNTPIWVRPVAVALSVAQQEVQQ
ncbi:hypothetical protein CDO39_19685 [Pseudomonas aeruginosa]|uniref:Uncharacterized protein n=1 Tax=Pseudomonas aeruginosa TaxID=287 RepID=A0A2D1CSX0_PSEAI|nr:hypothetical protein [Pseudomonas aeruginosa]ATN45623.1 hypothetical protein [P2virus sp.] [Pseudomonas aeruginosa]OVZ01708.1 hypothetical protein CDO39_19685 [Pseudomonas aeruginosa]